MRWSCAQSDAPQQIETKIKIKKESLRHFLIKKIHHQVQVASFLKKMCLFLAIWDSALISRLNFERYFLLSVENFFNHYYHY